MKEKFAYRKNIRIINLLDPQIPCKEETASFVLHKVFTDNNGNHLEMEARIIVKIQNPC